MDPYGGSTRTLNPGSWNRYAYVNGDPINFTDRFGLDEDSPEDGPDFGDDNPTAIGCLPPSQTQSGSGTGQQNPVSKAFSRLNTALTTLQERTSFSQNCQRDIGAIAAAAPSYIDKSTITIGAIQAAAGSTSFANGVGSQVSQSALYPNSPHAASVVMNQNIGALFANPAKITTAVTTLGGNTVYINASLISGSLSANFGLLMHEMLH